MRTFCGLAIIALVLPLAGGCDAVSSLIGATSVTVELVNNGDYPVDATMFYYDDQDVIEELLTEIGDEVKRSVAAGETTSFSRDCDKFQAFMLEDADLRVLGDLGPEASTDVFRDGDEFNCGDTIVLTFDHLDALGTGFDVDPSIR